MNWLIYALGGGYGHVTRAMCLAKFATRRGIRCSILYNSHLAHRAYPFYSERLPQVNFEYIPSNFEKADVTKFMRNYLSDLRRCDRVIVDTFPRGIAGELDAFLPNISCTKILISRYLNQKYIESIDIDKSLQSYNAVVHPKDSLARPSYLKQFFSTEPWLLCSADEIFSQEKARQHLQLVRENAAPVIGFLGSGQMQEIIQAYQWAKRLRDDCPQLQVVFFTLEDLEEDSALCRKIWPAMQVYPALDLLVCSGGHNAINEAKVTNTQILVIPRKRRYDRQDLRATERPLVTSYKEIRIVCESLKIDSYRQQKPYADFANGAQKACTIIENLSES